MPYAKGEILAGRHDLLDRTVLGRCDGVDQVLAISRVVQRRHVPVTGTAPDGSPYAAGDPRLLAWVSLAP